MTYFSLNMSEGSIGNKSFLIKAVDVDKNLVGGAARRGLASSRVHYGFNWLTTWRALELLLFLAPGLQDNMQLFQQI